MCDLVKRNSLAKSLGDDPDYLKKLCLAKQKFGEEVFNTCFLTTPDSSYIIALRKHSLNEIEEMNSFEDFESYKLKALAKFCEEKKGITRDTLKADFDILTCDGFAKKHRVRSRTVVDLCRHYGFKGYGHKAKGQQVPWTEEDKNLLKQLVAEYKNRKLVLNWTEIAERFEGRRTPASCKIMYYTLMKKEKKKEDGDVGIKRKSTLQKEEKKNKDKRQRGMQPLNK